MFVPGLNMHLDSHQGKACLRELDRRTHLDPGNTAQHGTCVKSNMKNIEPLTNMPTQNLKKNILDARVLSPGSAATLISMMRRVLR